MILLYGRFYFWREGGGDDPTKAETAVGWVILNSEVS
jgi:hypothetical protein